MSFQQLLDIIRDGAAQVALERDQERDDPQACPNDGEPLRQGPDGLKYCAYDGWRPDTTTVPAPPPV